MRLSFGRREKRPGAAHFCPGWRLGGIEVDVDVAVFGFCRSLKAANKRFYGGLRKQPFGAVEDEAPAGACGAGGNELPRGIRGIAVVNRRRFEDDGVKPSRRLQAAEMDQPLLV